MGRYRFLTRVVIVGLLALSGRSVVAEADEKPIDFNRQIRSLLSDKCYACHGPAADSREGGFRLDQRDSALGEADSGERPIVPGDPAASEIYVRLTTDDEFMRMPPAETNKSLTADEIELIRKWIEQGAEWNEHWSLIAPERPSLPEVQDPSWPRNEIDRFILKRLEQEGLKPAPEADKTTLIRRVTFDLTGLPPTTEEVDAFLADDSPDAYGRLVDRLQQSPHYGEHQARFWLDAARYGDTHGLHLDNYREMWPYRDWVVNAFNANLPYDRFIIEQLAGDLLPDATLDQLIATGFNRCHVTTNEGGSIVEEVRVRNVIDRVVTTGTVFMGMTFDCTRCHDHKYDPFTMNDFYSLFAFFNSMDGSPMDGNRKDPAPVISVLTDAQKSQIAELRAKVDALQAEIRSRVAGYEYVEPEQPTEPTTSAPREIVWIEDEVPAGARAEGGWQFVDSPVHSGKKASKRTAEGLSQHFFTGASEPLRVAEGDRLFAYVYLDPANPPKQIMMQFNDGSWEHRAFWGGDHIEWGQLDTPSRRAMGPLPEAGQWARLEVPAAHVGLNAGAQINGWAFTQFDGTVYWDKAGIVTTAEQQPVYDSLAVWWRDQRAAKGANLPDAIRPLAQIDDDKLTDAQRRQIQDHFVERVDANTRSVFAPLHQQADDAAKQITQIESSAAITLIYREAKTPRPAQVLNRGEYDQPLHEVPRATPPALPPLPEGAPLDRLGLAQWLVAPEHPLTARVHVNRVWLQLFGTGIVKTADDFGSQGDVPSHPELLDWMAVDFREGGWDIKRLLKTLVTSAAYRQSSRTTPELVRRDPENRLLARGPRFRLDAEMLRDQALAVSGLLVRQMGGPSVKPPQPDGLWFAVGYSGSNTVRFKKDEGPDKVHRRTLYTFIKRTSPPPQMSTFDAPSREACTVRRERTNTPLQALLLLNDPQYFEAARMLGQHILRNGGETPEAKAAAMFRTCAARPPKPTELAELLALYEDNLRIFQDDPDAAKQMIAVGESKPDETLDPVQSAAWTVVANTLLNLDEVLTKN
jgi:hypothetical protein